MASCHRYHKSSKRVELFARFCGIPEAGKPLDLNHLNFFLYLSKYVHGNPKRISEEIGMGLRCLEQPSSEATLDIREADHAMNWLHSECFRSHRDVLHEATAILRTKVSVDWAWQF